MKNNCQYNNTRDIKAKAEAAAIAADTKEECIDTRERRATTFSDPVCINANNVYDSCRDRDCVTNQRVYFTEENNALIRQAINVKLKSAEVIWVYTNVEPLSFNKGYFSVDIKFFVLTTIEVFTGICNPTIINGLTTYDKRVVLYGSESNTKIFTSKFDQSGNNCLKTWQKKNMPTVTVEVAGPVPLSAEIKDEECCSCGCNCNEDLYYECDLGCTGVPNEINEIFDGELVVDDCARQVLVTYGLFYIVRLERDTQLLVEAVDFCIPTKECQGATEDSPCNLFNDIRFPIDEFFPPKKKNDDAYDLNCNCNNSCC